MFELDREVKRCCRSMMPGLLHRGQRLELEDQLYCMIEEFVEQGHGQEKALELALARLGKMDSVKAEYRKNINWFGSMNSRRVQVAALAVGCAVVLAVCVLWRNDQALTQARSLLVALCNIPNTLFGATA